jgi:hypothetical protein
MGEDTEAGYKKGTFPTRTAVKFSRSFAKNIPQQIDTHIGKISVNQDMMDLLNDLCWSDFNHPLKFQNLDLIS